VQIIHFIFVAVLFAIFYSPVHLPFLISFKVKSPGYLEIRWALRVASAGCLFLAVIPPAGIRHDFGDDVGGNFAGAAHNLPIMVAWIWGGGLACIASCLAAGFIVRWIRRRGSSFMPEETAE
jgi:hypothetical protein